MRLIIETAPLNKDTGTGQVLAKWLLRTVLYNRAE